jgi:putative membrane protein
MENIYPWIKVLHIVGVIAWMAGLLYLPRLFVYHVDATVGSPQSETFKIMERRLFRAIMNPAMIVVWVTGPYLAYLGSVWAQPWLISKLVLVVVLTFAHHAFSRWRKNFERDENNHSARFFRIANEVPTILLIAIVIFVVLKPF